jgi:hypothetical protein
MLAYRWGNVDLGSETETKTTTTTTKVHNSLVGSDAAYLDLGQKFTVIFTLTLTLSLLNQPKKHLPPDLAADKEPTF